MNGGADVLHVHNSKLLYLSSNTDPNYVEKGVVFLTTSAGINVLRDAGTSFFNFFGKSGFENGPYEGCKLKCLQGLEAQIPDKNTQKLCNVKLDIENNNKQTIFVHGYGQLYERKQ